MDKLIEGFFYGLYMDPELLTSLGVNPVDVRIGKVEGYKLDLKGAAKILPAQSQTVWGTIIKLSPEDLHKMYSGETTKAYRPEPMQALTKAGEKISVSCYNLPVDDAAVLNVEYRDKLLVVARNLSLPADYINLLERMS